MSIGYVYIKAWYARCLHLYLPSSLSKTCFTFASRRTVCISSIERIIISVRACAKHRPIVVVGEQYWVFFNTWLACPMLYKCAHSIPPIHWYTRRYNFFSFFMPCTSKVQSWYAICVNFSYKKNRVYVMYGKIAQVEPLILCLNHNIRHCEAVGGVLCRSCVSHE